MSEHIESEAFGDEVTALAPRQPGANGPHDSDVDDSWTELAATPPSGTPAVASDNVSPNGASDAEVSDDEDAAEDPGSPADLDPDQVDLAPGARGRHVRHASLNRAWVGAVIAAAVSVAGAGIALAVTSSTHDHKRSGTPPVAAPPPHAGPPCPLTAVPTTKGVPQRPALAIKIDNYPVARPQSGLDKADIVFEEPVEGGITRLVAVFQCQSPALAGPIRSARAVDLPILDQLSHPVFLHMGGINPVINMLQNGNLIDDNLFYRGSSIVQHPPGRYAPYSSYVSGDAAWGLNPDDTTPPKPVFQYSWATPAGTAVTSVHIPFSGSNDVHWAWDTPSGRWLLSWGSSPATVANGGQIAVSNIVVLTVHVTYGPWLENDVGGYEVQSQLVGSGPLEVLRGGIEVSGTWQRPSNSTPTNLVSAAGTPIPLAPGVTWVEIVPSSVTVTTATPAPPSSGSRTHSSATHAP